MSRRAVAPEAALRAIIDQAAERLRADLSRTQRPTPALPAAREGEHERDPVIDELLWSYLVWEAGETRAAPRFAAIAEQYVDLNDLRVGLPADIAGVIGVTYPKAAERTERLLATLNDIFHREHAVSLSHLTELPKRKAKAYLASLEAIPAYVATRVGLVALGIHGLPLDERLTALLAADHAVPEGHAADAAAGWAERQVRSGEAIAASAALEHWAGERRAAAGSRTVRASSSRGVRPNGTPDTHATDAASDGTTSTTEA
ncbi:MAG: hypothetical protein AAGF47_09610 [Planctomycetota bacterium]